MYPWERIYESSIIPNSYKFAIRIYYFHGYYLLITIGYKGSISLVDEDSIGSRHYISVCLFNDKNFNGLRGKPLDECSYDLETSADFEIRFFREELEKHNIKLNTLFLVFCDFFEKGDQYFNGSIFEIDHVADKTRKYLNINNPTLPPPPPSEDDLPPLE